MAVSVSRKSTARFCSETSARLWEYAAGLSLAIERGWLTIHESGTFVRFTQSGSDLFA